jgi:hypothetical protein
MAAAPPASAMDFQAHGYAAQGFVLSSGNNVFGDSTHGSINYFELGVNGVLQLRPDLLVAAQAAARDAGATDTGVPRLDYYLVDYRPLSRPDGDLGLRIGKVKTPLGFFNATRDVIFTRPGILLPSIYADNQGTRNILFAAQGAQIYGDYQAGAHDLSITGTLTRNRNLSDSQKHLLIDLGGLPFNLRLTHSWNLQVMDSFDAGRWQLAYSHFYGRFLLSTDPSVDLFGNLQAGIDIFSARYNAQHYSITAEYGRNPNIEYVTVSKQPYVVQKTIGDGAYLQGDYHINPRWDAMLRFNASFSDEGDRNGHKYANENPGGDAFSRFAYDLTVGASWRIEHWGAWGEYHWINGTETVQPLDNVGRTPNDLWSLFMLMVAYKF